MKRNHVVTPFVLLLALVGIAIVAPVSMNPAEAATKNLVINPTYYSIINKSAGWRLVSGIHHLKYEPDGKRLPRSRRVSTYYTQVDDTDVYKGECVDFVRALSGNYAHTSNWIPGPRVTGMSSLAAGTVIATFRGDSYDGHVAVFAGFVRGGFRVFDQNWLDYRVANYGRVAKHNLYSSGSVLSDADSYRVVRVPGTAPAIQELTMTSPLRLTFSAPGPHRIGDYVTATFQVKNTGNKAILIQRLNVVIRTSSGRAQDISGFSNFTLNPGAAYSFKASRRLSYSGSWTAKPGVKYNDAWRTIKNVNSVSLKVYPAGLHSLTGNRQADIAALYDYGGGASRWHAWLSDGTRLKISNGYSGWWATSSGYVATKVVKAVSGDFNNDSRTDVAALYDYGGGKVRWHVWKSTGSALSYTGSSGWWGVTSGYTAGRVKHAVSGDFNADGCSDIAVLFDYSSGASRWHVWLSDGARFRLSNNYNGWWRVDSGYNAARVIKTVAGDFNADARCDVAALYDYGKVDDVYTCRWHVWLSTGSSFNYVGKTGWWTSSGSYNGSKVRCAVSGDFNKDRKWDVAVLYDYGQFEGRAHCRWHVWLSIGTRFSLTGGSNGWWKSTGSYVGTRVKDAVAGDFDMDARTDIAAMYDYGSGNIRWHVWLSGGSALKYQGGAGWWSGAGYYPAKTRAIVPGGS